MRGLDWRGGKMNGNEIDMRMFAQRAGANVTFSAGSVVFNKGDPGSCMYIVQSGVIEMMIGDKVIESAGQTKRSDSCR
jgi:CRP-like cAMP-binding protein